MEKRQPYGSLDFLGADTYGWPLPARNIVPSRKDSQPPVELPKMQTSPNTVRQPAFSQNSFSQSSSSQPAISNTQSAALSPGSRTRVTTPLPPAVQTTPIESTAARFSSEEPLTSVQSEKQQSVLKSSPAKEYRSTSHPDIEPLASTDFPISEAIGQDSESAVCEAIHGYQEPHSYPTDSAEFTSSTADINHLSCTPLQATYEPQITTGLMPTAPDAEGAEYPKGQSATNSQESAQSFVFGEPPTDCESTHGWLAIPSPALLVSSQAKAQQEAVQDEHATHDDTPEQAGAAQWISEEESVPPTQPVRFHAPSIFELPTQTLNSPYDGYWPAIQKTTDRRSVFKDAAPLHAAGDPDFDYPPIVVERADEYASRQILRLYIGEKSAMTLLQTYLYNSICFEEDCPRLTALMNSMAADSLFLTQLLGKLSMAFGADPRPRVMQQFPRGQYWSSSFVKCIREPRRAILELIELERYLLGEVRRFVSINRDAGAKALLARIAADSQRRIDSLNHTLTLGCV